MIEALGGETQLQYNLRFVESQPHVWPLDSLRTWAMPHEFLSKCRIGTLQYCFVQPICVVITFILQLTGKYGEGEFKANVGYPYIATVRSLSQTWAIYCLVLFYLGIHQMGPAQGLEQFETLRVVPKFINIKGIVFFTFWQGLIIAIIADLGIIQDTEDYSSQNIAIVVQDMLIIVEMVAFAAAHVWAFRTEDFEQFINEPLISTNTAVARAILGMPRDLVSDAHQMASNNNTYANSLVDIDREDFQMPTI